MYLIPGQNLSLHIIIYCTKDRTKKTVLRVLVTPSIFKYMHTRCKECMFATDMVDSGCFVIINILKIRKLKSVGGGGRPTIAVEAIVIEMIAVEAIAVHPGGVN